jgi:hypothetical protein
VSVRLSCALSLACVAVACVQVEEACTTDILGAAISGLNGFSTGEKLAKMGRDPTAMVNSTEYVRPADAADDDATTAAAAE